MIIILEKNCVDIAICPQPINYLYVNRKDISIPVCFLLCASKGENSCLNLTSQSKRRFILVYIPHWKLLT